MVLQNEAYHGKNPPTMIVELEEHLNIWIDYLKLKSVTVDETMEYGFVGLKRKRMESDDESVKALKVVGEVMDKSELTYISSTLTNHIVILKTHNNILLEIKEMLKGKDLKGKGKMDE